MPRPVNIIVPVYRGLSLTRSCLESLAASALPTNCKVTIIDDASPETGMGEMLLALVEKSTTTGADSATECDHPAWELLRNDANRGFVASVNRGMACYPDHDVVLLNSDTAVPSGWIQRLRSAAYRRTDIGTVTPFSNSGSLASYPIPNIENELPKNYTVTQLDQLFASANASEVVDIPTGVGFCLFIRRDCLDDTGTFDEASFGKGYGEENDFCLRAGQKGWTHVLAADCFVYHRGRGSFGEEKDIRVKQAYKLLISRYPRYPSLIQQHFATDPARPFRYRVDLLRLVNNPVNLGITSSLQEAAAGNPVADDTPQLLLSHFKADSFEVRWLNKGEAFKLWFRLPDELHQLQEFLHTLQIANVDGKLPSWLPLSLPAPPNSVVTMRNPSQIFDLLTRHANPRLHGWSALQQILATHGSRRSGSRLLRPLAAILPQALRIQIRNWIKANRT